MTADARPGSRLHMGSVRDVCFSRCYSTSSSLQYFSSHQRSSPRTLTSLKILLTCKNSRRSFALKRHWNMCGVLLYLGHSVCRRRVHRVEVVTRVGTDDGGLSRSLRHIWSDHLRETMCKPIPRAPVTQIVLNATGQSTARKPPSHIWEPSSLKSQTGRMRPTGRSTRGG